MALYVSICLHRCVSIRVLSRKTECHWWQGPSAEENGLNVRAFLLLTSQPSVLHQLSLRCDLMSNKTAGQREKGIVTLVPCIKYTRTITRTLPLETRVANIRVRLHYSISHWLCYTIPSISGRAAYAAIQRENFSHHKILKFWWRLTEWRGKGPHICMLSPSDEFLLCSYACSCHYS